MNTHSIRHIVHLLFGYLIILMLAGCGEADATPTPQSEDVVVVTQESAIPAFTATPEFVSPLSTVSPLGTVSPLATPFTLSLPDPVEDGAVVGGELYSIVFDTVIPGTAFYFTPAIGDDADIPPSVYVGSDAEKGDVLSQSDESGRFIIPNIPPGNYFLVVWAPYSWVIALEDETSTTPKLFVFETGQQYDLGRLYFDWPN